MTLALFSLDPAARGERIVERYMVRRAIERSSTMGKQRDRGVRQARDRVKRAVERTVPFGMLIQVLVVDQRSTLHGCHADDATTAGSAGAVVPDPGDPSLRGHDRRAAPGAGRHPRCARLPRPAAPDLLHDPALACAAAAA